MPLRKGKCFVYILDKFNVFWLPSPLTLPSSYFGKFKPSILIFVLFPHAFLCYCYEVVVIVFCTIPDLDS